jgi:HD-GYP domain-containing protein (c-di-GMP phosphodiesterase class II)
MSLELRRALYNISALADLGQEVTSEKTFSERIQSALYSVMGTFLANKGAIFWLEKGRDKLVRVAHKGLDESGATAAISSAQLVSLRKDEPYLIGVSKDASSQDLPRSLKKALAASDAEVLMPLWVRDEFIGLLVLGRKFSAEAYTSDDFEILKVVAHQIAITLNNHALFMDLSDQVDENRRLYEEMRRIYHDTIQAFAAAIDAKDPYTRNHSQRVAKYSVAIGRELGWDDASIEGIYIAGFLHDVGKLVISNDILNKKETLTDKELRELRRHPTLSYKILSNIKFPWKDVVKMIKHHHEKLDGTGYPAALTTDELSDGVKVLSLADSFDAMTSERSYRTKMDLSHALEELKRCLGTQFDGRIVAAFCRVLEKEIKGELPEPNILPHLDPDFDPSVITGLLEALVSELSG